MSEYIVSSAKDALVWLVLLISGAVSMDMPQSDSDAYMDRYLPGAAAEELAMVLRHSDTDVTQLVERLAAADYATRLHAEQLLTAMGSEVLPALEKARETTDDPHTYFVLESIIHNINKPSVSREHDMLIMLALRRLDPQVPDYDAILREYLSGKNYFVEKVALDVLMQRRGSAAVPTVLQYVKKVSPTFSNRRPGRMAQIYRWLGDESLSGKDSGVIRSALLAESARARGRAFPALIEAIDRRAGRAEVAKLLAYAVARDKNPTQTVLLFAQEVSGKKVEAKSLTEWLKSDKNFADVPAAKWNEALAHLGDALLQADKAAERAAMNDLLVPDTFLAACLDIDELRSGEAYTRWITELFGHTNYTLQDKAVDFLAFDAGIEINRIYLVASGPTPVDNQLFVSLITGRIDIARLRRAIRQGRIMLALKGEFDAAALNACLARRSCIVNLKHGSRDTYITKEMSLCVLNDSTILVGLGESRPEVYQQMQNGGIMLPGMTPGAIAGYRKTNGSQALYDALDILDAAKRPERTVLFPEESGIFCAVFQRTAVKEQTATIVSTRLRLFEDDGLHAEIKFHCVDDDAAQKFALECKALVTAGKIFAKSPDKVFSDIFAAANIITDGSSVTVKVKIPAALCEKAIRFFASNPVDKYTSDEPLEDEKKRDKAQFPGGRIKPGTTPGGQQKQPPVQKEPGGN